MKISVDTEQDTYDSALAAIQAAFGVTATSKSSSNGKGTTANGAEPDDFFPGGYTKKKLKKFAEWLTADAAEAVRYIAAHAPAVSIDEVIAYMGEYLQKGEFNGKHMGGRMASVGFAVNSIAGVEVPPYDTDYKNRMYRMDENIAAVLLECLGAPGQE